MKLIIFNTLLFLSSITTSVFAKELPLYEFGVGGGVFNTPHYPGSDQRQQRELFIPIFRYRGKILKADKGGMRAEFIKTDKYLMDLSFSAAFPANSKDNKAREGMPDLDWIGEIGPRFKIHLIKDSGDSQVLDLNLQLRAVLSTDFNSITYKGNVFHPVLKFRKWNLFNKKLSLSLSYGVIWSDEKIMDYFYEVDTNYVTETRKRFNAKAGLIEQHIDLSISYKVTENLSIFSFMQNNYYSQATNKTSPLHLKDETTSYAIGVSWYLYQSDEMVIFK